MLRQAKCSRGITVGKKQGRLHEAMRPEMAAEAPTISNALEPRAYSGLLPLNGSRLFITIAESGKAAVCSAMVPQAHALINHPMSLKASA